MLKCREWSSISKQKQNGDVTKDGDDVFRLITGSGWNSFRMAVSAIMAAVCVTGWRDSAFVMRHLSTDCVSTSAAPPNNRSDSVSLWLVTVDSMTSRHLSSSQTDAFRLHTMTDYWSNVCQRFGLSYGIQIVSVRNAARQRPKWIELGFLVPTGAKWKVSKTHALHYQYGHVLTAVSTVHSPAAYSRHDAPSSSTSARRCCCASHLLCRIWVTSSEAAPLDASVEPNPVQTVYVDVWCPARQRSAVPHTSLSTLASGNLPVSYVLKPGPH